MGLLAKIRRMHFRDGVSLREIVRQTGLSRNTLRSWLRRPEVTEPKYPVRQTPGVIDPWADTLRQWLSTDAHRTKRERRTVLDLYRAIRAQGYPGGYGRVCAFVRRWRAETTANPPVGTSTTALRPSCHATTPINASDATLTPSRNAAAAGERRSRGTRGPLIATNT